MTAGSTTRPLEFLLNGRFVSVENAGVQTTVLDLLRGQGLTGAKEGCAEGECGACTILLVANHGDGCQYRSVNSCLMFVPALAGQEIYMAEAQKAMANGGGSQCGYCTPGFVMSLFAEQYRPGRTGPCDPHAMGGNLCRCTGYRPIRDAALSLGPAPEGPLRDRLSLPAPQLDALAFDDGGALFERPTTLDQCIAIAARDPQVRWIAGSTDLGVESNLRFRRWPHLASVEAVPELLEFTDGPDSVRIGGALPLAEIEARWKKPPELVRQWLPLFASPTIRNRATLGGNLATASPIGDGAPMLMALDATLHLAGPGGRRTVPLTSFFTDYRCCALAPGELIVAVEIPKPFPAFTRFYKVAKRRMDDISTVAAGFSLDFDASGRVARARFAFGGVAATPWRAYAAEDAILGQRWSPPFDEASVTQAQAVLAGALNPIGDHRGSAEYRREVAQSLIAKFFWEHSEALA
jgi:xanthine dehydrogenase small subunit